MTAVIIATAAVAAIGLIAGIILSVASVVMAVPVDEKEKKIRECLPGANCGACGYSGCDGYASALAKGNAEAGLCTPGGSSCAKQISEILGVEAVEVEKKTAFVHCLGNCDNTEKKINYQGAQSCAAAMQIFSGGGKCSYGCIGFGDCVSACGFEAIKICNGIAAVNTSLCTGCGKCIKTCPKGIIDFVGSKKAAVHCSSHDKGAAVIKSCKAGCIGCMMCVKACENGAVTVENNLAKIDGLKCTGCGKCAEVCKKNCISLIS